MTPVVVAACAARLLAGTAVAVTAATAATAASAPALERGKRIFHGLDAVPATVQQHVTLLPAHVSRCINCHSAYTPSGVGPGNAQYLSATTLSSKISRRGGPAYRYDQPTFCATIRTGVDPAAIMLEAKMPRYRMSDAQCADLWFYLSGIR